MLDLEYDKKLIIKTTGIKEWEADAYHYNRCEPTPYQSLEHLFKFYQLPKSARLVDFGSGKGRVAFYVHNRFAIPVLGIEGQKPVLEAALTNKKTYQARYKNIAAAIDFVYGLAEDYTVQAEDNVFFFFNPFSADVFQEVLGNITLSLKQQPRPAHLILYYPLPDYRKIMKKKSVFTMHDTIIVPDVRDRREIFIIYKYLPAGA